MATVLIGGALIASLFFIKSELQELGSLSANNQGLAGLAQQQLHLVQGIQFEFKLQVQEWKDVLLRGRDAQLKQKHWNQFLEKEASVAALLRQEREILQTNDARVAQIDEVIVLHKQLGGNYRAALVKYPLSRPDAYRKIDAQVRGADRQVDALLARIEAESISGLSRMESGGAANESQLRQNIELRIRIAIGAVITLALFGALLLWGRLVQSRKQASAQIAQAQAMLEQQKYVLDQHAIVSITDEHGTIVYVNDKFCQSSGYAREELIGQNHRKLSSGRHGKEFFDGMFRAIGNGKDWRGEICNRGKDGTLFWTDTTIVPFTGEKGVIAQYIAVRTDITERKAGEARIERLTKLYKALSEVNQAIVRMEDESMLFPLICKTAVEFGGMRLAWVGRLTGAEGAMEFAASHGAVEYLDGLRISASADEPEGNGPSGISLRENRDVIINDFLTSEVSGLWHERAARCGLRSSGAFPIRRGGKPFAVLAVYHADADAFDVEMIALFKEMSADISFAKDNFDREAARIQAAGQIERLAFYDHLTGLPNRPLMMDRLGHALAGSTRSGHYGAILFIDLDNFKMLNDTKGHDVGDQLLKEVAARLLSCVREEDTVARLGGDEFVVILENLGAQEEWAAASARTIGEKIIEAVNQPFVLAGHHEHYTSPSIGVVMFAGHEVKPDEMIKRADAAMYRAKEAGRNTLRFYNSSMQAILETRNEMALALRKAQALGQFHLHYQLQVNHERRPIGTEILLRWDHPVLGRVSPDRFIPLAEEMGLIVPIGEWVLERACAQIKAWENSAHANKLHVAVNVSAKQFHHPQFVECVQQIIEKSNINPALLKLELTESVVLADIKDTVERMVAIQSMGVGLSMDDFGTGYSSLSYLKRLPLDQLKIDRSFIRDIATDRGDEALVQAILGLARNFYLDVIAEGVETEQQFNFLSAHGCQGYQGYLFAKPVPVEQFEQILAGYFDMEYPG